MAATPQPASRAQVEKQMRELLLADLPGQARPPPALNLTLTMALALAQTGTRALALA